MITENETRGLDFHQCQSVLQNNQNSKLSMFLDLLVFGCTCRGHKRKINRPTVTLKQDGSVPHSLIQRVPPQLKHEEYTQFVSIVVPCLVYLSDIFIRIRKLKVLCKRFTSGTSKISDSSKLSEPKGPRLAGLGC